MTPHARSAALALLLAAIVGCEERTGGGTSAEPPDVGRDIGPGEDSSAGADAREAGAQDASDAGDDGDAAGDAGDAAGDADANAGDGAQPVRVRDCATRFAFEPDRPVGTVLLAGEWDWDRAEPMERTAGGFALAKDLPPAAGPYCYKLVVDGEWILDPANPVQAYCDGVLNSGVRVADCASPLLTLDGPPATDGGRLAARLLFHAGADGSPPASVTAVLLTDGQARPLLATLDPGDWSLEAMADDLPPGKHALRVEATDAAGRAAGRVLLPFWVEAEHFDWRDALIYMVMTDRFVDADPGNDPEPTPDAYPAGDWQGGDLAGITERLEAGWFEALGVRALWLTPLNAGAQRAHPSSDGQHLVTGYHGYWPIRARELDPRLGTEDDLRRLVATAHARGIRVLADLVVNHVHEDHEYFAAHPEWFNDGCTCGTEGCDWTRERLTCLFNTYMPDLDWKRKDASEQVLSDIIWWLEEFDLDGGRIDAVKHVDDLCVANLTAMVAETFERAGTDYFLVGETAMGWSGDSLEDNAEQYGVINHYMGPHGLDGQFDFVLFHAVVENVFLRDAKGAIHLDAWTGFSQNEYLPGSVMTPYIGSHDTSRFVSLADYRGQDAAHSQDVAHHKWAEDGLPVEPADDEPYARARAALCWLLTTPGAPMVYQGDEYGEFGGHDPDNRHLLRREEELSEREASLLAEVRALGQARRALRPLRRGAYESLGSTEEVALYARRTEEGEAALVAVNVSPEVRVVTREVAGLGFGAAVYDDFLSFGGQLDASVAPATLTVPARSCAVFVP